MKKLLYSGFGIMSLFMTIALLAGTHTAVGVASCGYCKTTEIAATQSDALDEANAGVLLKNETIVADNKTFIKKETTAKAIKESFKESHKQVDKYAEKEKTNSVDNTAELMFTAKLLERLNKTKSSYELAANTLFNDGLTSLESGHASRYQKSDTWQNGFTVTRAVARSGERFYRSSCGGAFTTIKT